MLDYSQLINNDILELHVKTRSNRKNMYCSMISKPRLKATEAQIKPKESTPIM